MREFDSIFAEVCKEKDVKFISLFNQVPDGWNGKLFDGLHPDSAGHNDIYEQVKPSIINELKLDVS